MIPLASLVLLLLIPAVSFAQSSRACAAVQVPDTRPEDNMLDAGQEAELGRLMRAQFELATPVIEDPAIIEYLQAVSDRLIGATRSADLRFQFRIIDLPAANAFSFPGGGVYLSRKIVGVLASEDELAFLLAHEMAHALTHDQGIAVTRAFRKILGVTSVDTAELFERWNEVVESRRPIPGTDDEDQAAADRLGLEMARAAGYRLDAGAAFFDRLAGLNGRTGNRFSDLLGSTPPDAKRLRALNQLVMASPCGSPSLPPVRHSEAFKDWQSNVLRYRDVGHGESLPGLLERRKLDPALQPELDVLRFSPDGRHILAQDEMSITLYRRETLAPLFRIDAEAAMPATFSADSQHVSFLSTPLFGSPRVETWSMSDHTNVVREVYVPGGCLRAGLSPPGTTMACFVRGDNFNGDLTLNLRLIDVSTGAVVLERKSLVTLTATRRRGDPLGTRWADVSNVSMTFSPDGRYILLGSADMAQAFDVEARKAVSLEPGLKRLIRSSVAFLDTGRVIGGHGSNLEIMSFPEGEVLQTLPVGGLRATPITRGPYLLLQKSTAVGVLDLRDKSVSLVLARRAADVFDDLCVREREDGKLALLRAADGKEILVAPMGESRLRSVRAGAVAPDGRFIAISARTRSGVWELQSGRRVLHLRGFESAWLGEKDVLHAVTRESDEAPRALVRFDLAAPPGFKDRAGEPGVRWSQGGRYIVTVRAADKDSSAVTLEVRDVTNNALLWTRALPHDTRTKLLDPATGLLVLGWQLSDDAAGDVVRSDPAWQPVLRSATRTNDLFCLDVIDARTGSVRGRVPVDGISTVLANARVTATTDRLILLEGGDSGRVLAYSFDGSLRGRALATDVVLSPDGRRAALHTGIGRVVVVDVQTLAPVAQLDFTSPVSLVSFPADSRQLVVLDADQTVYTIALEGR